MTAKKFSCAFTGIINYILKGYIKRKTLFLFVVIFHLFTVLIKSIKDKNIITSYRPQTSVFIFVLGVKKAGSPKQESVGALGGLSLRRAVDAGEKDLRGAGRESPTEPALCPREGPSSLDGLYKTTLFI